MMRVLVVDVSRLHFDADSNQFVDDAGVRRGSPVPGKTLSTDVAAYALLALRTARRSLDSELTLYGNTKPDAAGIPCPLDAFPLAQGESFSQRLDRLIESLASTLYESLTLPDGRAFAGWDRTSTRPTDDGTSLDAHAAAIRGLLTAYLATGATRFRDRAERVYERIEASFYDPAGRIYRGTAGDHSTHVTFTPRRFGLLQGALRDAYELIGLLPGKEPLRHSIESRIGRLNKLVLNGWDDRNEDQRIEWPSECVHVGTGPDGEPLGLGGLQMAERTLTGETGSLSTGSSDDPRVVTTDRDHDCVPEISAAGLPAALANSITFELTPFVPPSLPGDGGVGVDGTAP